MPFKCNLRRYVMEVSDDMTTEFLQFDPAPRRGEEQNAKRCPEYFL